MAIPILKACLVVTAFVVSISSCTPRGEEHAALYSGTWKGTCFCTGGLKGISQVTFATTGKNMVVTQHSVGDSTCAASHQMNATVNSNTMTIPSMTVSDNCGNVHNVSANGSLDGNTLTFIYSETSTVNGKCTFMGFK